MTHIHAAAATAMGECASERAAKEAAQLCVSAGEKERAAAELALGARQISAWLRRMLGARVSVVLRNWQNAMVYATAASESIAREVAEQQVHEVAAATAGARSHLEGAIQRQRRSAAHMLDAVLRTITRVSKHMLNARVHLTPTACQGPMKSVVVALLQHSCDAKREAWVAQEHAAMEVQPGCLSKSARVVTAC